MPLPSLDMPEREAELRGRQWIAAGNLMLGVDVACGGRIVSFSRGGAEVLTPASLHPQNYGSTLWDSPQSTWNWPPRATLDSLPYRSWSEPKGLVMESEVDATGMRFTKRFVGNALKRRIEIEYRIENCGPASIRVAPWEVTRAPGGLSFFPIEAGGCLSPTALQPLVELDGICWYAYAPAVLERGRKLFALGREGWIAHVAARQRQLFVKTFPITGQDALAPEQGAVEIWGHDDALYIELENHGAYRTLEPGESLSYPVCWSLEPLPDELRVGIGDSRLLSLAREIATR